MYHQRVEESSISRHTKRLRIKNHYVAVLNQEPSDVEKVFSESSLLTNKYDYSFTITEIRTALKTSRSNTAPGSDGISIVGRCLTCTYIYIQKGPIAILSSST